MLALILSSFPEIELTGCTTAGTFSSYYGFSEDSISLILFSSDSIEIKTGIGWNATERPVEAAVSALNSARKNLTKKERLCLVFPDGYSNATSEVINALNKQLNSGCALFGGSSGRHATTRMRPLQFFRNEVVEDALPILLFGGPIEYSFDVCNSWKPIGRRKKITKSEGNVIKQIGKQNALDYYHKYLGKHSRPDYEFPLAVFERPRGDSFYIRVPTAYDESEGNLTLGATVQLSEATPSRIIDDTERSVTSALKNYGNGSPAAALVFSCNARKGILGTRVNLELQTLQKLLPQDTPIWGFYGFSEFSPLSKRSVCRLHHMTMVTLLIGSADSNTNILPVERTTKKSTTQLTVAALQQNNLLLQKKSTGRRIIGRASKGSRILIQNCSKL